MVTINTSTQTQLVDFEELSPISICEKVGFKMFIVMLKQKSSWRKSIKQIRTKFYFFHCTLKEVSKKITLWEYV